MECKYENIVVDLGSQMRGCMSDDLPAWPQLEQNLTTIRPGSTALFDDIKQIATIAYNAIEYAFIPS